MVESAFQHLELMRQEFAARAAATAAAAPAPAPVLGGGDLQMPMIQMNGNGNGKEDRGGFGGKRKRAHEEEGEEEEGGDDEEDENEDEEDEEEVVMVRGNQRRAVSSVNAPPLGPVRFRGQNIRTINISDDEDEVEEDEVVFIGQRRCRGDGQNQQGREEEERHQQEEHQEREQQQPQKGQQEDQQGQERRHRLYYGTPRTRVPSILVSSDPCLHPIEPPIIGTPVFFAIELAGDGTLGIAVRSIERGVAMGWVRKTHLEELMGLLETEVVGLKGFMDGPVVEVLWRPLPGQEHRRPVFKAWVEWWIEDGYD